MLPFSGAPSDAPLNDPVEPSTPVKLTPPKACCEKCGRVFDPIYVGGDTLYHEEMLYRQTQRALRMAHRATDEIRHRDLLAKWSWVAYVALPLAGIVFGALIIFFMGKG